ncbi:cysteine/glutathione ABC transporter ATP-binding protein/permease CydC [Endozoicomonas sp. OPT23]|uniref:heme ABC transporter ATP-binding protein/permease CydC n=1 Tax=Endozoicomonas sp. OPT23 TaxID=2072845 RepID=UPI00129B509D|nr:cysteine/glutathione ABC transporter ATP-binding protein/permease CydC [Endozoicomonas sp. OPT23]MRI34853.1 cysteine/glutathione ABC transporter ATP-binding protein/permease CydC [Endozoicomonas sp. OPT23]
MRELLPFIRLFPRHAGGLTAGILLAFVTILFSLSLLALSGWFITATALAGMTLATAQMFDFFSPGAGVRGFAIGRTAARYFERLVSHDATFKLLAHLRSWLFKRLLPLPLSRLKSYRKADLLNRLVADVDALDQLYLRMLSPVVSALLVTGLLPLGLSLFSPILAKAAFILLVFWLVLLPILFYRKGYRAARQSGLMTARLRQRVLDYLQAMADLEIYGSEASIRQGILDAESELYKNQQQLARLDGLASALLALAAGVSSLIMLYLAAGEFQQESVTAPVMVLSVFAVLAAFEAIMPLPAAFQFLGHTRLAASRLNEVLEEQPVQYGQAMQESVSAPEISFANVSFSYGQDLPDILNRFNLTIPAGHHVAVVGRTGSGKSTLINLLLRQLEPAAGSISLAGVPVSEFTESSLYSTIAVIPQKTHVFSDTLRNNLLLARPGASDRQLLDVIDATGLNALNVEEGGTLLDLWLGEAGVPLSGGEQRRLAVARALLKDSPVLVMDEASEGLDPISEEQLISQVLEQYRKRTLIMISHQKQFLDQMDQVVNIDQSVHRYT